MSRFSEDFTDHLSRLNGNTQAAIYHVFEQQLTDRGLVSEPEFFLPLMNSTLLAVWQIVDVENTH